MIRVLGGIILICITLFAKLELECIERDDNLQTLNWENGVTLLGFLEENSIPLTLYYNLEVEDKELVAEIKANEEYFMLQDENFEVAQALIPINNELQIHIYKDTDKRYKLDIVPIEYQEKKESILLSIKSSPYQDILEATQNSSLANEFIQVFKKSLDFKNLKNDDKLAIIYTQRYRLGKNFGDATIEASMVEANKKRNFLFLNADGKYYDERAEALIPDEETAFDIPVAYRQISSEFTLKRFHPILKRYRAHLGIDYAASVGTPVKASGDGKITFVGTQNGYGKTVIIRHPNGFETLYAHLNGFKSGISSGMSIKKGQLIAYVGSTGLSSGPHLHFGVYKNNNPINPRIALQEKEAPDKLALQERDKFIKMASVYKDFINMQIARSSLPLHQEFNDPIYLAKLDKIKK